MIHYAGFYLKFTFSGNNVPCYTANTPSSLILPQSGCIACDTSNYNYTLTIPSNLTSNMMIKKHSYCKPNWNGYIKWGIWYFCRWNFKLQ